MGNFNIQSWLRPNIRDLKPYSSARDEFSGEALVFLDANENPYENGLNRYPDPGHTVLRNTVSSLYKLDSRNFFFGNGSDEAIDLLIRASCTAEVDSVLSISPSYGMYGVCAAIQGVRLDKVLLNDDFSLSAEKILAVINKKHKLIFLCSPNNPTGNLLDQSEIEKILNAFEGVVVVDEAYIEFSNSNGLLELIAQYPNLVLLRTFSKAWGLAGVRCGMAIAQFDIIAVLMKIKYPYNLNTLTQKQVLETLGNRALIDQELSRILEGREYLMKSLNSMADIQKVYPSEANFILIKIERADIVYEKLIAEGIVVRIRNTQDLCQGCLRISVGTEKENQVLIAALKKILS